MYGSVWILNDLYLYFFVLFYNIFDIGLTSLSTTLLVRMNQGLQINLVCDRYLYIPTICLALLICQTCDDLSCGWDSAKDAPAN